MFVTFNILSLGLIGNRFHLIGNRFHLTIILKLSLCGSDYLSFVIYGFFVVNVDSLAATCTVSEVDTPNSPINGIDTYYDLACGSNMGLGGEIGCGAYCPLGLTEDAMKAAEAEDTLAVCTIVYSSVSNVYGLCMYYRKVTVHSSVRAVYVPSKRVVYRIYASICAIESVVYNDIHVCM